MTGIYYTDMVDAARAAGCNVQIPAVCNGWERRARSSGGFPSPPLGVWWHHTASNTAPLNDLEWQINQCDDAPVGNWLIDRDGICYPVAAGASNCAGKSEAPKQFSRGECPVSQGNTRGWQIEVANSGVGGAGGDWSEACIGAFFRLSNCLNQLAGNLPTDVISHALGDGTGYTNRKVDPARSDCVQGAWVPRSTNSNGTWKLDDIKAECQRRAGTAPGPTPLPPGGGDDMLLGIYQTNGPALYVCYSGGNKFFITDDGMWTGAIELCRSNNIPADPYPVTPGFFAAMGLVVGPRPDGTDAWGNYV